MAKTCYSKDYSIRATPKMLFNYISGDTGLASWFAEKAVYNKDKDLYNFVWEDKDHYARLVSFKPPRVTKFVFLGEDGKEESDPAWIEMKISTSELTNETFLTISDYSNMSDLEDLEDLWDGLVTRLKEVLGGG